MALCTNVVRCDSGRGIVTKFRLVVGSILKKSIIVVDGANSVRSLCDWPVPPERAFDVDRD